MASFIILNLMKQRMEAPSYIVLPNSSEVGVVAPVGHLHIDHSRTLEYFVRDQYDGRAQLLLESNLAKAVKGDYLFEVV